MWEKGDILELLSEARMLQSRHQSACESSKPADLTRQFTKLMHQGKVNSALSLITEGKKGGVLPLSSQVISALTAKHPPAEPLDLSAILPTTPPVANPVLFAGLSGEMIRKSAIITRGAADPSGGDAD